MGLFNIVTNRFNAIAGRNQEFEQLIKAKDIDGVINQMENRDKPVNDSIREYNTATHEVMKREDKMIFDEKGYYDRTEKRWRIPIPYQSYINEIALVFLYGRPVKWNQRSEGTDEAFKAFSQLITDISFDAKIRQCKRLAGAETQSALLFRVFRNRENKPDVQLRVLAKSKGDEIYVRWDQYENIVDIGWGYYLKEGNKTVYHFDLFTPEKIYHCKRDFLGWEVKEEVNFIGKIPIILFQQPKEWDGVQAMIEREEYVLSRTADTNDYFADPIMLVAAQLIANLPNKKEEAKLLFLKNAANVNDAAKLLTWDSAPESKKLEREWLQMHISTKSFTPILDFDKMQSLSNISAKALKQMMVLADIKAAKHKESHDDLLKRTAKILIAILGNVLDVSLKAQCDQLKVGHEFQEPFGEDVKEVIDNLIRLKENDLLSQESGVEQNPLVKDPRTEIQRLKQEKEAKNESFRNRYLLEGATLE